MHATRNCDAETVQGTERKGSVHAQHVAQREEGTKTREHPVRPERAHARPRKEYQDNERGAPKKRRGKESRRKHKRRTQQLRQPKEGGGGTPTGAKTLAAEAEAEEKVRRTSQRNRRREKKTGKTVKIRITAAGHTTNANCAQTMGTQIVNVS